MTGPTTAEQLFHLAVQELAGLHRRKSPPGRQAAPGLAAGWPGLHRAGERLVQILREGAASDLMLSGPLTTGRPDPALQRAADYLGAAADLAAGRDRSLLTAQQCNADADAVAQQLAGAAAMIAAVTAGYPALLYTTVSAAAAAQSWQRPPAAGRPDSGTALSLADASTLTTAPAGPTGPGVPELTGAVHAWQQAALAAGHAPAPSQLDLLGSARTAGMLTRLAQVLLLAYADLLAAGTAAGISDRLRRAGQGWNAAADLWRQHATGGVSITPELREAGAALESAVRRFARSGSAWASPPQLRAQATPDQALHVGRAALTAAQALAEQHAPLIAQLGQTGELYTQAKNLPVSHREPTRRVEDRLASRWVRLDSSGSAPLVAAYQWLPAATAAARMMYTAVTDPVRSANGRHRPPPAPDRRRQADPTAGQVPVTVAGQRWAQTLAALDPRLLDDPHYPALAAALDRVQLTGADVATHLAAAAARRLPDTHPARALHFQLVEVCPAAVTPFTDRSDQARPPVQPAAMRAPTPHRDGPPTSRPRR